MGRKRKALVALGTFALIVAGSYACLRAGCKDETTQRLLSPSGEYRADVGGGYCAVSPWLSYVFIRRRPFALSSVHIGTASNIFYVYADPFQIKVRWEGQSRLVVECQGCKGKEMKIWADQWKGVSVKYVITSTSYGHADPDR